MNDDEIADLLAENRRLKQRIKELEDGVTRASHALGYYQEEERIRRDREIGEMGGGG